MFNVLPITFIITHTYTYAGNSKILTKRQPLLPFPRTGKRTSALILFLRTDKKRAALVAYPRTGKKASLLPFPRSGKQSLSMETDHIAQQPSYLGNGYLLRERKEFPTISKFSSVATFPSDLNDYINIDHQIPFKFGPRYSPNSKHYEYYQPEDNSSLVNNLHLHEINPEDIGKI